MNVRPQPHAQRSGEERRKKIKRRKRRKREREKERRKERRKERKRDRQTENKNEKKRKRTRKRKRRNGEKEKRKKKEKNNAGCRSCAWPCVDGSPKPSGAWTARPACTTTPGRRTRSAPRNGTLPSRKPKCGTVRASSSESKRRQHPQRNPSQSQRSAHGVLQRKDGSATRGARRRLHLQRDEEGAREDQKEDEGVVRHQGPGDDG